MKCISRSTLGVVIGILNVLGYIGLAIFAIISMVTFNKMVKEDPNGLFSNTKHTPDPNDLFSNIKHIPDRNDFFPNRRDFSDSNDFFSNAKKNSDHFNTSNNDKINIEDAAKGVVLVISRTMGALILVGCIIMIIISSLLITGIVKRRHAFMCPWLILNAIGFVGSCIRGIYMFFTAIIFGQSFGAVFLIFVYFCLVIVIEGLIIYAIYTLYKDIRNQHIDHPGHVISYGPNK